MGFPKDSIRLSLDFDFPILKLLWEAETATSSQLWELLNLEGSKCPSSRSGLANRLHRLRKHDYIRLGRILISDQASGYFLLRKGMAALLHHGIIHPTGDKRIEPILDVDRCTLTLARIAIWAQGHGSRWVSRRECQITTSPVTGEMVDEHISARVVVNTTIGSVQINIVCGLPQVTALLQQLSGRKENVDPTLVLAQSEEQASWMVGHLQQSSKKIWVSVLPEFLQTTLYGQVYDSTGKRSRLINLLEWHLAQLLSLPYDQIARPSHSQKQLCLFSD